MSAVGRCGDNAPAENFFSVLKRERINRRRYRTVADALDHIERFHNPRVKRRLDSLTHGRNAFTRLSVKTG